MARVRVDILSIIRDANYRGPGILSRPRIAFFAGEAINRRRRRAVLVDPPEHVIERPILEDEDYDGLDGLVGVGEVWRLKEEEEEEDDEFGYLHCFALVVLVSSA